MYNLIAINLELEKNIILSGIKATPKCDIFGRRQNLNPGLILNRMHSTPQLHPLFLYKQTGVTY